MKTYAVDFTCKYFGTVDLQATDPADAEEQAKEYVIDIHDVLPEDVEIISVEMLKD